MKNSIIENLKNEIEGAKISARKETIGHVAEVGDGIAKITGLSDVIAQEMLSIETSKGKVQAIAFNLEEDMIGAIILGESQDVKEGDMVTREKQLLSIEVGDELIGRVVNALGQPIDGKGPIFASSKTSQPERATLEHAAPGVLMRSPVNTPLHTGIAAIDAMIPIGRGQRELIIGDRQIGKTAIVIDTIINQQYDTTRALPICIYVAIGQREAKIAKLVADLKERGAMSYTIVVSAPASSPASLWYLAPMAGAAIGEYFMHKGRDAVVIYDDLSKHASAYRQLSLLLRRPPGREAFPGDIFYLHSRLLERAAQLSKTYGGGSLTALPIIETQLSDVTAYIPTNVISITDGQIYLEPDLFYQGVRPAINVGLSVSRVGSAAQTKAMKKIAGKLRLELAQFRELQAFVQFATDLDPATKKKIARGTALTEILKQSILEPMPFEQEVVSIWLGTSGNADHLEKGDIQKYVHDFRAYLLSAHPEIFQSLRESEAWSDGIEAELVKAVADFVSTRTI